MPKTKIFYSVKLIRFSGSVRLYSVLSPGYSSPERSAGAPERGKTSEYLGRPLPSFHTQYIFSIHRIQSTS